MASTVMEARDPDEVGHFTEGLKRHTPCNLLQHAAMRYAEGMLFGPGLVEPRPPWQSSVAPDPMQTVSPATALNPITPTSSNQI